MTQNVLTRELSFWASVHARTLTAPRPAETFPYTKGYTYKDDLLCKA
jgi:hypothetical protein